MHLWKDVALLDFPAHGRTAGSGEVGMSDRPEKRMVEFIESYWTGGEFGADYQWNDNHGELVRCKDCTHAEHCEIYAGWDGQNPEWYCGDGERKKGR